MKTCLEFAEKAIVRCFWCAALILLLPTTGIQAGTATNRPESELRLASDYVPNAIRIHGDSANREIRSIEIVGRVPQAGDGSVEIWLDPRLAELNIFGDIVKQLGPKPAPIQVKLQYVPDPAGEQPQQSGPPIKSPLSKGSRLYDIVFPGGEMVDRLKLALTATGEPHKLLVYGPWFLLPLPPPPDERDQLVIAQILAVYGTPATTSVLPDFPLRREIDLSGFYGGQDGRMHRVEIRGTQGGEGTLVFDPNYFGFDAFVVRHRLQPGPLCVRHLRTYNQNARDEMDCSPEQG